MSSLSELAASRELVSNLTARELKGKYKRSVLGWGWSLLNPLATMLIFTVVFSLVLRVQVPPGERTGISVFGVWLLCGLLPWTFVSNAMNGGIAALVANGNLIKKVYFPREALIASTVLALVVTLAIELSVLSVALLLYGNVVIVYLPGILALVGLLTLFALGIALGLSVLNVYFRDMQYFVSIFLQMWFYATPIVYPISLVQDRASTEIAGVSIFTLYQLNPMAQFVEAFRDLTYDLHYPSLGTWAILLAWSLGSLVLGQAQFSKFEGRLAAEL